MATLSTPHQGLTRKSKKAWELLGRCKVFFLRRGKDLYFVGRAAGPGPWEKLPRQRLGPHHSWTRPRSRTYRHTDVIHRAGHFLHG